MKNPHSDELDIEKFWRNVSYLIRHNTDYSRTRFAEALGLSCSYVIVGTYSKSVPNIAIADKMARALGVKIEDLMYGEYTTNEGV